MGGEDGRPVPPRLHAQREQLLAEMQFSSTLPVFSTLLADRTGHLWVKEYDPEEEMPPAKPGPVSIRTFERPSRWDVFDPQGRWLCTVEMPGSFTPLEIGADHVAGVWRDTDDVEHVRLYRLIKP